MPNLPKEKSGRGRKPRAVPRKQQHFYLTADCSARVAAWVAAERSERAAKGERACYSRSDAIHDMVDIASFYHAERNPAHRFAVLSDVLGSLWHRRKLPWVRIEPNSGRVLRCIICKTTERIQAKRFGGIMRAIGAFIDEHRDCPQRQP